MNTNITTIEKNSFKAWLLAMRLHTIPLSLVPVITVSALAYKLDSFNLIPALVCLTFAGLMQIVVNLSNDYYDFINGADTPDRVGFTRLVANGLLEGKKVLFVTAIFCAIACLLGLTLIFYSSWWLIFVGLFCVIGAYGYTAGPYPFAYHALGDLVVFIFFGLVSTAFSFYVQALEFHWTLWILGIAFGLTIVNILVVNNVRDVEADRKVNKITSVVLFGTKFGEYFYLVNGLIAGLICLLFLKAGWLGGAFLPQLFLIFHFRIWRKLCTQTGSSLDNILKQTVLNVMLLGGLIVIGLLLLP
ncbi:MAG: 1,4-dihydroxy-2-naphthoate octaprenyltransferase [Deltaproteobacteria bacterium]|jgi:1,4-dihydroxy-2-naphthoate octaprenyltransferase|nr:1,4-dihydroxy-2-naphthoate octaprenyltransferase [Deltaproteobacteria bacterium]